MSITRSLSLFALLLTIGCRENPLDSESDVITPPRTLKGEVRIREQADDAGAYVWLESFNLGTATKADGSFSISLPSPSAQGTPGGVTGAFQLYYYIGNYRLDDSRIATLNGQFVLPNNEFDKNGKLFSPRELRQMFAIQTEVGKNSISSSRNELLNVVVDLWSIDAGVVKVFYPRRVGNTEGPLLFHHIESGDVAILSSVVGGTSMTDYVDVGAKGIVSRVMLVTVPANTLKPGVYEIIPYLLYNEQTIPPALFSSLGKHVLELHPEYIRIPFKRIGGRLVVE